MKLPTITILNRDHHSKATRPLAILDSPAEARAIALSLTSIADAREHVLAHIATLEARIAADQAEVDRLAGLLAATCAHRPPMSHITNPDDAGTGKGKAAHSPHLTPIPSPAETTKARATVMASSRRITRLGLA